MLLLIKINMKKTLSLLFIFFTLSLSVCAQSDKVSTSVNRTEIKDSLVQKISVEELQAQITKLSGHIKQLTESENKLKGKQYDNEQIIKEQKATIKRLEQRLLFADSIVARLSNDCLCKKYDSQNVDNAIRNFERMYSDNLKSKFRKLKILLINYERYTQELAVILNDAQNDSELSNPFTGQKRAMTYVDKIKSTAYYREAYHENWTIPYLNSVIDKSIETFKTFNPRKAKGLHLIDLLK